MDYAGKSFLSLRVTGAYTMSLKTTVDMRHLYTAFAPGAPWLGAALDSGSPAGAPNAQGAAKAEESKHRALYTPVASLETRRQKA